MLARTIVFALVTACGVAQAAAQSTIFIVRHAERADAVSGGPTMMAADPDLSDVGRRRAEALAVTLGDAGITAIYTTEFRRTQQTAAPVAKALGLTATTIPARDTAGLVQALRRAQGAVLVVGHSNTVPEILEALGVTGPPALSDSEYDNLFIVVSGTPPRSIRLHYR